LTRSSSRSRRGFRPRLPSAPSPAARSLVAHGDRPGGRARRVRWWQSASADLAVAGRSSTARSTRRRKGAVRSGPDKSTSERRLAPCLEGVLAPGNPQQRGRLAPRRVTRPARISWPQFAGRGRLTRPREMTPSAAKRPPEAASRRKLAPLRLGRVELAAGSRAGRTASRNPVSSRPCACTGSAHSGAVADIVRMPVGWAKEGASRGRRVRSATGRPAGGWFAPAAERCGRREPAFSRLQFVLARSRSPSACSSGSGMVSSISGKSSRSSRWT
jgi:hypothetical protein